MSEIPTVQLAYQKPNNKKKFTKWIVIFLTLCGIGIGGFAIWNYSGESIGRWYSTFRYNRAVSSLSGVATRLQNLSANAPERAGVLEEATTAWKNVRYWHLQNTTAQYASEDQTPQCDFLCERTSADGHKWLVAVSLSDRSAMFEVIPNDGRDLTATKTNEIDIQLPTSDSKMIVSGCDLDTADKSQFIVQTTVDGATRSLKTTVEPEGTVQCNVDGWYNEPIWWPGGNDCKLVEERYKFTRAIDLSERMYQVAYRGSDEIAVASMNQVQILDLNGKSKRSFQIDIPDKKESASERLGISDNGKWVFIAARGFPWRVYNVDTGALTLTGEKTESNCWLAFPDGDSLVVSNGTTTQTYDLPQAKLAKKLDHYTRLYAIDQKYLATASDKQIEVQLLDRATNTPVASMPMPANGARGAISPDGKYLVMTGSEGVHILDATTKKMLLTHVRNRLWYDVSAVKWSSDSKFAVMASGYYLYLFRAQAPQQLVRMIAPMRLTACEAAISPDNKTILAFDHSTHRKLFVLDISAMTDTK